MGRHRLGPSGLIPRRELGCGNKSRAWRRSRRASRERARARAERRWRDAARVRAVARWHAGETVRCARSKRRGGERRGRLTLE
jgi:hypothetical protein